MIFVVRMEIVIDAAGMKSPLMVKEGDDEFRGSID
jgi:hypothetical protein